MPSCRSRLAPWHLRRSSRPYAFVPLVAALALWRWPGHAGRLLRVSLVLSGFVFAVRFTPGWIGLPQSADVGAPTIAVTSWNLKLGEAPPSRILEGLRTAQPGIVALQELTPRHARAIAADPELRERFPYRVLRPRADSSGLGLLSSYPVGGPPCRRAMCRC